MSVRQLANNFVLNGGCAPLYPPAAVAAGLVVEQLLEPNDQGRYPVVYFYLRTEAEPVTSATIAKLFLNLLKHALRDKMDQVQHSGAHDELPIVTIFNDECQNLMDDSIRNMLEQGASMGMQFVLANQDISQLSHGDEDFLPTVWENCGNKIILSSRDLRFQDLLMKLSGEKLVHMTSYGLPESEVRAGRFRRELATDQIVQVQELAAPRFERNDLIELSACPGRGIFKPAADVGLAQYAGYPILVDFPFAFTAGQFQELRKSRWPSPTPETVIASHYTDRWEEFLEQYRA